MTTAAELGRGAHFKRPGDGRVWRVDLDADRHPKGMVRVFCPPPAEDSDWTDLDPTAKVEEVERTADGPGFLQIADDLEAGRREKYDTADIFEASIIAGALHREHDVRVLRRDADGYPIPEWDDRTPAEAWTIRVVH